MCGIVGIASDRGPVAAGILAGMRDAMHHRGPDDAGIWCSPDRRVAMAQRRLAIIDLSPGGHQPMSDNTDRLHIVFNGEIYNYRELRQDLEYRGHVFRSASDTEVILEAYRAWGIDCLARLNGMFAFAIHDEQAQQLFLARDRAGEKPLFYSTLAGRLTFASELKALMADAEFPRNLDLEALEYYLTFGYVPGQRCILRGVCKLPPGHALRYDLTTQQTRVWSYWRIPDAEAAPAGDETELIDRLEALLRDAVRRQLVADVPVGILLSGGVDSSLITALAAGLSSQPLRTFNISFPGHGSYDESGYARIVARHFGTEHVELAAEPATVELLPALARQFDEPMCDSSMVPTYLVSRLIRQHATVAVGGDGGDELFGGYRSYEWVMSLAHLQRRLPRFMRKAVAGVAALLPLGLRGRNYLMSLGATPAQAAVRASIAFDAASRGRMYVPLREGRLQQQKPPETYKDEICQPERGLPGLAMALDFQTYLSHDILTKVDRASMLNSLEVRAPFLDHRVIEFAFRHIPNRLRVQGSQRKILLRRLAQRHLPPELNLGRKQGFSLPLARWFKGEWGRYMESVVREADASLFDRRELERLIAGQRRGLRNTERLFMITMFELWRREYRVTAA